MAELTFTDYLAEYGRTGDLAVVDLDTADTNRHTLIVTFGDGAKKAIVQLCGLAASDSDEHLRLDVHTFVNDQAARASVFDFDDGVRYEVFDQSAPGRLAVPGVTVLIGSQVVTDPQPDRQESARTTTTQDGPIPGAVTSGGRSWPVLAAVPTSRNTDPCEYIVVTDRGTEYGTARYATHLVRIWSSEHGQRPRPVVRDGEYDLTWPDACRSLISRAGLAPRRRIESVSFVREPHHPDVIIAYADGRPLTEDEHLSFAGAVCHIDPDDDPSQTIEHGLRALQTLSPAVCHDALAHLNTLAHGGDHTSARHTEDGGCGPASRRFSVQVGDVGKLLAVNAGPAGPWQAYLLPPVLHRWDAERLDEFVRDASGCALAVCGAYSVRVMPLLTDDDHDAIVVVHLHHGDGRAASDPFTVRGLLADIKASDATGHAEQVLRALADKAETAVQRVIISALAATA